MDVKKQIKRLIAVGTGAIMIGATVVGAMAVDLSDYPGKFTDAKIVVGANAAASDVIGAIDIAKSLQKESGSTAAQSDSESIVFEKSNNFLELGEYIGDVKDVLTETDLSMLSAGKVKTGKGYVEYNQYLRFGDTEVKVEYSESEDEVVGDHMVVVEDAPLFEYELSFQSGFESEVEDNHLEDLEGEDIVFMGKTYNVMEATLSGTEVSMTLVTGSVEDVLFEKETKTYTIDGKDYEVKVLVISDSDESVKFLINGELTDKLKEGDVTKLEDGTELAVKEVIPNEGSEDEGDDMVEFYLGAGKLVLTDSDYTDSVWSDDVEMSSDDIEGASVRVSGTMAGSDFVLSSVEYKLVFDGSDDAYAVEGDVLSGFMDNAEGMLGLDLMYEGLDREEASEMSLMPSGDDAYKLKFVNLKGQEYSVPLFDTDGAFKFGSDDEDLLFVGNETIEKKDMFVLSDGTDDESDSYVFEYTRVDESDEIIYLKDLAGETHEVSFAGGDGELIVGGNVFAFEVDSNYDLKIDHDGDGSITSGNAVLVLEGGAVLSLGSDNHPTGDVTLELTTDGSNFDESGSDEVLKFKVTDYGDEMDVSVSGLDMYDHEENDDLSTGMSKYGVLVSLQDESSDPAELEVSYPEVQVKAKVKLLGLGHVEESTATVINVAEAVLDSDIEDLTAQNMVVVGGPCANEVAAKLLGTNPDNCMEGFEEGKAIVKLVQNGEHVALVVAGYSAADTRRAAKALANMELFFDTTEVQVLSTSDDDVTVEVPETA